jgi:hypothetical protein
LGSGTASSAGTEPSTEVLERLLEADDIRIKLAHRDGQAVLREVFGRHSAGLRDQLHRPERRLVVPIGQHVEMGVRDPLVVDSADRLGQSAIAQAALAHQVSKGLSERLGTQIVHRRSS